MRLFCLATLGCWINLIHHSLVTAEFPAEGVQMLSRVPLSQMGGGNGNDVWGWTDPLTGREYALFGRTNGTSFIDITDAANPVYLGNLPSHTGTSVWRDIKVYQNYAYVVSDGNGPHGLQIFDLTTLRNVTSPQTFGSTAHYNGFRNSHNLAINEETGFAYIVGSNRAAGGLYILDLANPVAPVLAGQFSQDGYTHDTQVVVYRGPDTNFVGREIAFNSNEDTLTIVDVTNKSNMQMLARRGYPEAGYVHQGWLTEDQRYFFIDDEFDELQQDGFTRTHVFDVSDLTDPIYLGFHQSHMQAIDHNQYIKGNKVYQANYTSGLRVLEIIDPATVSLAEVGYLDTYPQGSGLVFNGAWSVYPFFDTGLIIVSDITNGLFVARLDNDPGDFNADDVLDCLDANVLSAAIARGRVNSSFDLNGDGVVDLDDLTTWLQQAGEKNLASGNAYLPADANLDGVVDGQDFLIWNTNKFTSSNSFCDGDFNADGAIDGQDFLIWNQHKFMSSDSTQTVPEPGMGIAALLVCLAVTIRRY